MGWFMRLLGREKASVREEVRARAEDIVGAHHVGASVLEEREEDAATFPGLLLALTHGDLGNVTVARADHEWLGPVLEFSSAKGRWLVRLDEDGHVYMRVVAREINLALAEVGASGRLYNLKDDAFAYATDDEVVRLARGGLLDDDYVLAAERVDDWPLAPGTMAEFHGNGCLSKGTLARDLTIGGVSCAAAEVRFDFDGALSHATLGASREFDGIVFPPGTRVGFYTHPLAPYEAELCEPLVIAGLEIPALSTLHFAEKLGLTSVRLGATMLFDGGRAGEGDWLDYERGRGWKEDEDRPLWRPHIEDTHIDDDDIASLDDLRRLYPLPAGFRYETVEGRYLVERQADRARFSVDGEDERLWFCEKRFDKSSNGDVFDTTEVYKRKPALESERVS